MSKIDPTYGHRINICHVCSNIVSITCNHVDSSVLGWCKELGKEVDALKLDPDCELKDWGGKGL